MGLAIVLLILIAALACAWGFGVLARGRSPAVLYVLGSLGVALIFLLPLAYDVHVFDGNCYGIDGTARSCTLEERLWESFELGAPFSIPPALLWLAVFISSARFNARSPVR